MQVSLNEALPLGHQRGADLVALDDELQTLAEFDARKCKVVELRFFGGLSVKEKRKSCGFHYPWERRRLACHERGNRRLFPSRGDRFTCNGHLREVVCIAALANSRRDACAPRPLAGSHWLDCGRRVGAGIARARRGVCPASDDANDDDAIVNQSAGRSDHIRAAHDFARRTNIGVCGAHDGDAANLGASAEFTYCQTISWDGVC